MDELLEQLIDQCRPYASEGRLASYIPELTKADPNALGVYLIGSDGNITVRVITAKNLRFKAL